MLVAEPEGDAPPPLKEEVKSSQKSRGEPESQKDHREDIKPTKLRFSGGNKSESKSKQKKETEKKPQSQPPVVENRRRKREESLAPLTDKNFLKVDSEDLLITEEQKKIVDMLEVRFRRPKGNREFILGRELVFLKGVKQMYKEYKIETNEDLEDLDVCPQFGEKVETLEDGTRVWRQLDINAMKKERRRLATQKSGHPNAAAGPISLQIEGQTQCVGERCISQREAIDTIDNGKVKVLYHGEHGGVHIFVIEIYKGGKFVHKVENETVVSIAG